MPLLWLNVWILPALLCQGFWVFCNRDHCDGGVVKLKAPEARILKCTFREAPSEIHRNGRRNAKGSLHHYCPWKIGMASHAGMEATTQWTWPVKTLQLLSFSSSGERSCPQDCVLSVNKDDLSSRDHQQYCRGLNREDLCCLMPCPMSQFFGDTECWKEARLCLQITLDSSPNLALLKKKIIYLFGCTRS